MSDTPIGNLAPKDDALLSAEMWAAAALQQYQRAEMWAGIAAERLRIIAAMGIRARSLEERMTLSEVEGQRKWKEALVLGALIGLSVGSTAGLLFGFLKWGN